MATHNQGRQQIHKRPFAIFYLMPSSFILLPSSKVDHSWKMSIILVNIVKSKGCQDLLMIMMIMMILMTLLILINMMSLMILMMVLVTSVIILMTPEEVKACSLACQRSAPREGNPP